MQELGRDPLADGLTAEQLQEALGHSRQDLKVALMDQGRVAGLGNIHAAEALFRAGLHPAPQARPRSSPRSGSALTQAIHATLQLGPGGEEGDEQSIWRSGAENPFLIYGRAGTPCSQCRTKVQSFTQGADHALLPEVPTVRSRPKQREKR